MGFARDRASAACATGSRMPGDGSAPGSRGSPARAISLSKRSGRAPATSFAAVGRAEVGGDQQLLQLVQRRLVQPALGEDAGDALAELARGGAREPGGAAGRASRASRSCVSQARACGRSLMRPAMAADQAPAVRAGDAQRQDLAGAGPPSESTVGEVSPWPRPAALRPARCSSRPTAGGRGSGPRAAAPRRAAARRALSPQRARQLRHARRRRAGAGRIGKDMQEGEAALLDQRQACSRTSPRSRSGSRR